MTQSLSGAAAAQLVFAAADALKARKDEINKLNVFPVPDGDTGTNMSLTMDAVLKDLAALPSGHSLADACQAIQHGSLMGARGNSGVILSQILRGLCDVIRDAEETTPALVADALERATTVAFQAVRKPVEGTMLTVLRDAATAARASVKDGASLDAVLDVMVAETFESVRRSPELLPVLRENGVVDAGGFGLAVLAEGLVAALSGHAVTDHETLLTTEPLHVQPVDDWNDDEYLYCTEFLLFGAETPKPLLEEWVASHGGSDLVVGDSETYKIHVHTDDPGSVIAWATSLGEVGEVHINNMRRQTADRTAGIVAAPPAPPKPLGFVAVATGEGLVDILRSLGVDEVVNGGQTMNPSTAELLEAIERVKAEAVIVLPDNGNIVMAAQQAAAAADRPVQVVPTTSVPQAFAALLAVDPGQPVEAVAEQMAQAASGVRTGEVTVAVKDSKAKVGPIKTGQVIGLADHEIVAVGDDLTEVTVDLVDHLAADAETLTLLTGADLAATDADRIVAAVEAAHPDLDVEVHEGGQPLYPVLLAAE